MPAGREVPGTRGLRFRRGALPGSRSTEGLAPVPAKEPPTQITEEARDQLLEASAATRKAFTTFRREADPDDHYPPGEGTPAAADKAKDELEMSPVISIMQPILRFLQLLCENHNRDLQVRRAGRVGGRPDAGPVPGPLSPAPGPAPRVRAQGRFLVWARFRRSSPPSPRGRGAVAGSRSRRGRCSACV